MVAVLPALDGPGRAVTWREVVRSLLGGRAAERLIPAGFRVIATGNASSFDYAETLLATNGPEDRATADRAQEALGVGRVSVSAVPSGLADGAIVPGKDFGPSEGGAGPA